MALRIRKQRSLAPSKLAGAFLAVLALFVQPLVALNIPAAFADTADITQLKIETETTTLRPNEASSVIHLRFLNASGQETATNTKNKVVFTSSSKTGAFSSAKSGKYHASGWISRSNTGSSEKEFYFKDSAAGTPTLTAQLQTKSGSVVAGPASQSFTIEAARPNYNYNVETSGIDTFTAGEPKDFSITTSTNDPNPPKVDVVSNDGGANGVYEYKTNDGQYQDLGDKPFGGGAPIQYGSATSTFRATFSKPGTYTAHFEFRKAGTDDVIASTDKQFAVEEKTVEPAPDTTKPTASLNSPVENAFNPTKITVDATDETSLNKVTANIYDEANKTLIKSCSKSAENPKADTLSCDVPTLDDGVYTIRANASDKAGNISKTITRQFTIDHTKPDVSIKSDGTTGANSRYSKVSFKLHDAHNVVSYALNNGERRNLTPNTYSDANGITVDTKDAKYGLNVITVYDQAGNSLDVSFILDNLKPTISVKDESRGLKDKDIYKSVSFKLFDKYNVVAFQVNDSAKRTLSPSTYSDANDISVGKNGGVSGENTIRVFDQAGNVATYDFTLDNVGPTYELVQPGSAPVSGTSTIQVKINDPSGIPNNVYPVLNALDGNGQTIGETSYNSILVDATDGAIGISATGVFDGATVSYDDATQLYTILYDSTKFDDGVYSLYVEANDTIYNDSTYTFKDALKIDNTDPFVSLNVPGSGSTISGKQKVRATARDDNFASCRLDIYKAGTSDDPVFTKQCDQTDSFKTETVAVLDTTTLENGTYDFVLTVTDGAGNKSTSTSSGVTIQNDADGGTDGGSGDNGTGDGGGSEPEPGGGDTGTGNGGEAGAESPPVQSGDTDSDQDGDNAIDDSSANDLRPTSPITTIAEPLDGANRNATLNGNGFASVNGTQDSGVNTNQPEGSADASDNNDDSDKNGDVLGTNTDNLTKTAALETSSNGWKIFGVAWYWWLAVLAILGGVAWWFFGARRTRGTEG